MFKIEVPNQVHTHCINQLSKYNLGMRKEFNGTKDQQMTGAISESVMSNLFGFGYIDASKGFDSGIDIQYNGLKIDVKTMSRKFDPKPDWVNNFTRLQDHYQTQVYIFCSYNVVSNVLTVCGWIDKETFKMKRNLYFKGSERQRADGSVLTLNSDTYEIKNIDLNQCYSPNELLHQLDMYSFAIEINAQ